MFRNSYVNLPRKIALARLVFWTTFLACGVIGVATHSNEGHGVSPALDVLTPFWVCAWVYLRVLRKRVREMLELPYRWARDPGARFPTNPPDSPTR